MYLRLLTCLPGFFTVCGCHVVCMVLPYHGVGADSRAGARQRWSADPVCPAPTRRCACSKASLLPRLRSGICAGKRRSPCQSWKGVRKADHFGPRPMQLPIYGDMILRSEGMSEDCLYLNVWTPAKSNKERLPVLVYFYGGGFVAGDGSEPRYDGESMARKGIVAVTVNYRLGIFGFFAHPELTQESPHHASGNYGLLDQSAALQWVHQNIAAFGGDPEKDHDRRANRRAPFRSARRWPRRSPKT